MSLPPPILVVEDDPLIARAIQRALGMQSVPSRIVHTVAEALGLRETYLVAIVDINLPDGNGIDLYDELLERGRVTSGVFFSATDDEHDKKRARERGKLIDKSQGVTSAIRTALPLNTFCPPRSETRRASAPELFSNEEPKTGSIKD